MQYVRFVLSDDKFRPYKKDVRAHLFFCDRITDLHIRQVYRPYRNNRIGRYDSALFFIHICGQIRYKVV